MSKINSDLMFFWGRPSPGLVPPATPRKWEILLFEYQLLVVYPPTRYLHLLPYTVSPSHDTCPTHAHSFHLLLLHKVSFSSSDGFFFSLISPASSFTCLFPRFPPPAFPSSSHSSSHTQLLLLIPSSPAAATGSWRRGHADALRGGGVETWTVKLHTQRCPIMRLSGAAPRSTAASVVVGFWAVMTSGIAARRPIKVVPKTRLPWTFNKRYQGRLLSNLSTLIFQEEKQRSDSCDLFPRIL